MGAEIPVDTDPNFCDHLTEGDCPAEAGEHLKHELPMSIPGQTPAVSTYFDF